MVALIHRIAAVSGISHFSPQSFAPHTLNEQFPVGHWTLTECPHTRYSGEDRSSGQTDWRPCKQASSSSEIFQNQIIRTYGNKVQILMQREISSEDVRDHMPKQRLPGTPRPWSCNQTTDQTDGIDDRWMGSSTGFILPGFRIKHNRLIQVLKCCFQDVLTFLKLPLSSCLDIQVFWVSFKSPDAKPPATICCC